MLIFCTLYMYKCACLSLVKQAHFACFSHFYPGIWHFVFLFQRVFFNNSTGKIRINRLSKLCSSLQKQVSNKSKLDPPRQFSTQAIQVDTNSGLLHLNERKAPIRSDAHANPLVKSADTQVKQQTLFQYSQRFTLENINLHADNSNIYA